MSPAAPDSIILAEGCKREIPGLATDGRARASVPAGRWLRRGGLWVSGSWRTAALAAVMSAAVVPAVAASGGGLAAADGESVLALCPLPIAGLMSDRSYARVATELEAAIDAARELGSGLRDPFMTMSFLALEVIPSLKLTDRGLVDVERMQIVPLFPTS